MKKIATYIILLATLGSAACTRTDEFDIPLHQGSELVVKAELVSASDWKTRSGASSVAQDIEYGQSAESSDGQFLITATQQEWTAEQTDSAAFYPSAPDVPITRGTPITSASGINNMQVNVFQTGTNNWTTSSQRTSAVKATRSGSGYTTLPIYSWVVDPTAKTSLFAYSPVATGTGTTGNGLTDAGANKIKYTVPTTVGNQPDLCTAAPKMNIVNSDGTQQVQSFALKHQLTAVGFSMLGWNLKITKITVSGVAVVGTLTMNSNGTTLWATSTTGSRDVGVTQSSYTHNYNSSYTNITTSSGYLMMIPQTLTDAATVTINYASTGTGSASGTTTAKLKDIISTWSAGDKITYNIRLKTAPAVTSGDLTITSHKAGYTTSSPMTLFAETTDKLTFSWDKPWLKIHAGSPTTGVQPGGAVSPWSINVSDIKGRGLYFFTTNDNPSTTGPRTATVTVRGTRSGTKTFNVKQAKAPAFPEGTIPTSVLQASGWPANRLPKIGLQVAMRGNKQMPGTGSPGSDPVKKWKTSNTGTSNTSSKALGGGKENTNAMIVAGASNHTAAQYCREMGSEWYLPNGAEMQLIRNNLNLLGPNYSFNGDFWYWSSSEYGDNRYGYCFDTGNGGIYMQAKYKDELVRCVREI